MRNYETGGKIVNSVFRKLLSRELGEERYEEYCKNYRSCLEEKGSADGRKQGNKVIYDELYVYLEKKDLKSLTKMVERFADTMLLARQINRQYIFAFLFYLFCSLFLIGLELQAGITIVSLILMSVCFLYKTFEFVVNKFCYIDASIALVYKSVLDKLILFHTKEYME